VTLPYRGDGSDRPRIVPQPPARIAPIRAGRLSKRWCYVGVYGPDVMLCAGAVRVGGLPQTFWAVWAGGRLSGHTSILRTGAVEVTPDRVRVKAVMDLTLAPAGDPVDVVSDHHGGPIWTRKQPVRATGAVTVGGGSISVDGAGLVDVSAGYHARHTEWEWAAGVGRAGDGRPVAWNLVRGLHDGPVRSERTLWVDGRATEVEPVEFAPGLDRVGSPGWAIEFHAEAFRRRKDNLGLIASDYVQPFGHVTGTLPGGLALAAGWGVMERHRARW
jgi:hypothetical protein